MAFTTVTYTFTNGSTADATQVNQNFTDVLNGLSDTTKDFSMNNGTLAGTLTCNGNVVIGSSSSKTVNFLGSLISSVPVNANATYDLGGATLGFRSIYIGSSSIFTTKITSAATASWTFNLPATAGTNLQILQTDGSGNASWVTNYNDNLARINYGFTTSVSANALTINLVNAAGSNASSTSPVTIDFRNATAATGTPVSAQVTGALSVVVASGATLGGQSGIASYIYVWALNNAGTIELAVSGNQIQSIDEGSIITTTAMSGASTRSDTLYSTSGRANVAIRLLGRMKVSEAAAGTWASNPSEISPGMHKPQNSCLLNYTSAYFGSASSWATTSATYVDGTNAGGNALTIKQSSGMIVTAAGGNVCGITFTPASASAVYQIFAIIGIGSSNAGGQCAAQLTDGTININSSTGTYDAGGIVTLLGIYIPGVTSAVTVKIQIANIGGFTTTLQQWASIGNPVEWTIFQVA